MINLYNCFLRLKFCLIIVAQKKKACFLYETEQNNSSFLSSLPAFLPSFPFSFSLLIPSSWTYLIHWGLLVIQPFCSYRAWLGTLWETIVRRHKRGCPWIPCLCRFSRFTLCFFFQRLSLLELLYVSGINIWLKYFENFYLHFDIFSVFYFLSFFLFLLNQGEEKQWDSDAVYNSSLKEQKTLGTMADWSCFWRAHRTARGLSYPFSSTPLSPGSTLFPASVSSAKVLWQKTQRCKLLKTWPQREKKGLSRQKPRMILLLLLFVLTLR